jgi:hypothetical protein
MRQAAKEAGYAESTASHADRDIMPRVKVNFREVLRQHILAEKIAQRIAEGLEAIEVQLATLEGRITDERAFIFFPERRRYAELAARALWL